MIDFDLELFDLDVFEPHHGGDGGAVHFAGLSRDSQASGVQSSGFQSSGFQSPLLHVFLEALFDLFDLEDEPHDGGLPQTGGGESQLGGLESQPGSLVSQTGGGGPQVGGGGPQVGFQFGGGIG